MSENTSGQIDSVMEEDRLFPPSEEFAARCQLNSNEAYEKLYEEAKQDPVAFWERLGREEQITEVLRGKPAVASAATRHKVTGLFACVSQGGNITM